MHIVSIGVDLGKNTFHLVALGERSKTLLRKKFSRAHCCPTPQTYHAL
jgi:transposase